MSEITERVQERLAVMVNHIAESEWADTTVVPEHVREALRARNDWPFPEAWPSMTWREFRGEVASLAAKVRELERALQRAEQPMHEGLLCDSHSAAENAKSAGNLEDVSQSLGEAIGICHVGVRQMPQEASPESIEERDIKAHAARLSRIARISCDVCGAVPTASRAVYVRGKSRRCEEHYGAAEAAESRVHALESALVDAYEKAKGEWCAQCFCFTSAPETLRRNAHEAARDGFDGICKLLAPLAHPVLKREYDAATALASSSGPTQEPNAHTLTLEFRRFLSEAEWKTVVEMARQVPYVQGLTANAVNEVNHEE